VTLSIRITLAIQLFMLSLLDNKWSRRRVYLSCALTSLSHMVEYARCDVHWSACDQLQRNNYRYSLPAVTVTGRRVVLSLQHTMI